jgi:hypothetical protein
MSKKSLNVPKNMQPVYDAIVALTDSVCAAHLNAEYAELARFANAALCRKKPSPLVSGKADSWACGIVYALGFVNFLFDKSHSPYLSAEDLCKAFGVSKSNGAAKSKLVRDALKLMQFDPDWCLPSMLDDNPLIWMLEVNGLAVDIRRMPREAQEVAYQKGLIPYIPADQENTGGAGAPVKKTAKPAKTATAHPKTGTIHQLKVSLRGSKPPIWRRIQVASDTRLDALHGILQIAMGWSNYHLHQFITGKRGGMTFYGPAENDGGFEDMLEESAYSVAQIAPTEKSGFVYEYDFGDGWEHDIVVEKILPQAAEAKYPLCLAGKRACPPEDVGGIWGYEELLEIVKDPKHPEYQERLEWLGRKLDPEYFDPAEVNRALSKKPRKGG